jgi:hypothetical protein
VPGESGKTLTGYLLIDKVNDKIYVFDDAGTKTKEYSQLVAQGGLDYGTFNIDTGNMDRWKMFIAVGQFSLGGSAMTAPNFYSGINYMATGVGYEEIKRTSSWQLRLMGGMNYPYSTFDMWRPYASSTPASGGMATPLGTWILFTYGRTW